MHERGCVAAPIIPIPPTRVPVSAARHTLDASSPSAGQGARHQAAGRASRHAWLWITLRQFWTLGARMATHRFQPKRYHNVIGTAEPCFHLADGDTLITDTLDASGLDAQELQVG